MLAPLRERLLLDSFDFEPDERFTAVLDCERRAAALGYPVLV